MKLIIISACFGNHLSHLINSVKTFSIFSTSSSFSGLGKKKTYLSEERLSMHLQSSCSIKPIILLSVQNWNINSVKADIFYVASGDNFPYDTWHTNSAALRLYMHKLFTHPIAFWCSVYTSRCLFFFITGRVCTPCFFICTLASSVDLPVLSEQMMLSLLEIIGAWTEFGQK